MQSTTEAPIITMVCPEPTGDVERSIYPMPFTPENLRTFFEKASQFRTLFTDDINGDFKKFAESFISMRGDEIYANGLCWVIDDFVGVYYMTDIGFADATVHYTFFDRRHLGREKLTQALLRYVFEKYGFRRLTTEVPMYVSKPVFSFVMNLGFQKEGRKRKSKLYKGEWFDSMLFGLLREQAEEWDSTLSTKK